jgi:hypothetical protein
VEGLASLWRLASIDERFADLKPKLEERLACSAGILVTRQIDREAGLESVNPTMLEGAWISRGETRMDDQQHALSGLLYALNALDDRARRAPTAPVLPIP